MTPPPSRSLSAAAVVVAACWAVAAAALGWVLEDHVSGVPWADDWTLVPYRTGAEPVTAAWLWEPYAEHRIPLPKLLQIGLYEIIGQDAPAGTWFTTAVLLGLAALTPWVAAAARGRAVASDALLPLVWLQWGQYETLMHNFQVQYTAALVPTGAVYAVVVLRGQDLTWQAAVLAGAGLAALPLCGGNGVIVAAPLAAWLAVAVAAHRGRPGMGGPAGTVASALAAAAAFGSLGVYFAGYQAAGVAQSSAENGFLGTLGFFANLFGPAVRPYWLAAGAAGAGLCGGAVLAAAFGVARDRREWLRAAGLVAFLAAFAAYAAAIGRNRVADEPVEAVQSRYFTLAALTWCVVYQTADLYLPGVAGRAVRYGLLGAAVAVYAGNVPNSWRWYEQYATRRTEYVKDMTAGTPSYLLAEKHYGGWLGMWGGGPVLLDRYQLLLRDAKVEPFARMAPDPPHLRAVPAADAGGRFETSESETVYVFPAARRVYGVKFQWTAAGLFAGRTARVAWRPVGAGVERSLELPVDPHPRYVGVNAVVGDVRFGLADGTRGPAVKDLLLYLEDAGGR